jgi:cytochrome P450
MISHSKDFFTGGSGTMSKTMSYGILYLIHNPEVQDRVRAEIDQVGKKRLQVLLK